MKAAIYNPYLDTLGGGERYTLSFAKVLSDNGYNVDISWKEKGILEELSDRFSIKLPESINVVDDIKRGEGYDVCFWVSDGSIPLLRASKNFLHFQVPFNGVKGDSLFNKMKFFRIEKVICNSEFTKQVIDKEYGVKSVVIYPPVDTKSFKPKKKENLILYVGRFSNLVQNKGQLHLIKAFKKLVKNKDFKEWKLVLAGGIEVGVGDFMKTLKKKSNNLNVEIIKSPDFGTLRNLYEQAKFFWSASGFGVDEKINPDKTEHFGITVVESMAAGCVPIISNVGGHKEIVNNGKNGFLWDSIDEMVGKTEQLINSKDNMTKISRAAQKKSYDFDIDNFEKKVLSLL